MKNNSFIPRTLIIFFQVFGMIFSVAGLAAYIFYMGQLSDALPTNEPLAKALVALFLSLIVYFTWKTIYTGVVIIRFISKSNDLEISNNRYILSAFSLSLGGVLTPLYLTALPNIDVQSTINPRWFLSKTMGITSSVGASLGLITFFASALTGVGALGNEVLAVNSQPGAVGIVFLTISIAIIIFGLITVGLFYGSNNAEKSLESNINSYGSALNVVSSIWMGIITVELAFTIIFAILRLLGAIKDLFTAMTENNGFMGLIYMMLSFANVFLTLLYTVWIVKMTVATMQGLWTDQGIQYKEYDELSKRIHDNKEKQ